MCVSNNTTHNNRIKCQEFIYKEKKKKKTTGAVEFTTAGNYVEGGEKKNSAVVKLS